MDGPESWCLIESDPGVFTKIIEKLGVESVEFEEVHSLDDISSVAKLGRDEWNQPLPAPFKYNNGAIRVVSTEQESPHDPIFGLIFLFKYSKNSIGAAEKSEVYLEHNQVPGLFFAQQVIPNACATQAILSILLNSDSLNDSLGPELKRLKDFSMGFDPQLKGMSIGNSDVLRQVHNSFKSTADFFVDDLASETDRSKGSAFHFVSYVPYNGICYELDGLNEGPKLIGAIPDAQGLWTDIAVPALKAKIEEIQAQSEKTEIRFNLLACVKSRQSMIEESLQRWKQLRLAIEVQMNKIKSGQQAAMESRKIAPEVLSVLPSFEADLLAMQRNAEKVLQAATAQQYWDAEKRKAWERENILRQNSLTPLIFGALQLLARKGQLRPAYDDAVRAVVSKKASQ